MSKPLLTIAIPTYNRAAYLARLLAVLHREVQPLAAYIDVFVSDNASSDETPEVVAGMAARWPRLMKRRNLTNLGPDGNFCSMVELIETRYFWMIGDDDLPKIGALARILNLLLREEPALLYMQSEWHKTVDPDTVTPEEIRYRVVDREGFAKSVHLWTTFISGMVVDRSLLAGDDLRRYVGTFLVQLGWVFPALEKSDRFVVVEDACVVATQDNSSGYGVLAVFGAGFPRLARQSFRDRPALAEQLIDNASRRALPSLFWATREKAAAGSSEAFPWSQIRGSLGRKWRFWLVLLPLGVAPRRFARLLHDALLFSDRLRAKASRLVPGRPRSDEVKSIGAYRPSAG